MFYLFWWDGYPGSSQQGHIEDELIKMKKKGF
jgi:hypothetical protein